VRFPKKITLLLVLLLVLTTGCMPESDPDEYVISGTVLSEFGSPVQGSRVLVSGETQTKVVVRDDGTWTARALGEVSVTATASGYEFPTIVIDEENEQVDLIGNLEDLLVYYNFDESEGKTVFDSSGNENHGTLGGGAIIGKGLIGGAACLDGEDSFIEMPQGLFADNGNFTFSLWINLKRSVDWSRIIQLEGPDGEYILITWPGEAIFGYDGSGAFHGGFNFPLDTWFHLAISFAGNTWTYYVNGEPVEVYGAANKLNEMGFTEVNWIGKSMGQDPYLQADVDEFRIYTRALSRSIIQEIYAAGKN